MSKRTRSKPFLSIISALTSIVFWTLLLYSHWTWKKWGARVHRSFQSDVLRLMFYRQLKSIHNTFMIRSLRNASNVCKAMLWLQRVIRIDTYPVRHMELFTKRTHWNSLPEDAVGSFDILWIERYLWSINEHACTTWLSSLWNDTCWRETCKLATM